MQIEDNLTLLTAILEDGHSIIIPSDGVWGVACKATDNKAVNSLIRQVNYPLTLKEILVSEIPMLKKYTCNLHPRIETLLSYHERPLRIKCPQKLVEEERVYLRIVKDTVSRILLSELGYPLFFISFLDSDKVSHLPLSEIKLKDFTHVQFIASNVQEIDDAYNEPLLKIEFDDEGMIKVLT